jgi:hypothetical protein
MIAAGARAIALSPVRATAILATDACAYLATLTSASGTS